MKYYIFQRINSVYFIFSFWSLINTKKPFAKYHEKYWIYQDMEKHAKWICHKLFFDFVTYIKNICSKWKTIGQLSRNRETYPICPRKYPQWHPANGNTYKLFLTLLTVRLLSASMYVHNLLWKHWAAFKKYSSLPQNGFKIPQIGSQEEPDILWEFFL